MRASAPSLLNAPPPLICCPREFASYQFLPKRRAGARPQSLYSDGPISRHSPGPLGLAGGGRI